MIPEPHTSVLSNHLSEEQFTELLAGSRQSAEHGFSPAEVHVLHCEQCAAELDSLRESLSLFREASTAYANDQLRQIPSIQLHAKQVHRPMLRPMLLATVAALLLAALVPTQMMLRRTPPVQAHAARHTPPVGSVQHYAIETNEVLLEDVSQATSGSVPDAMQALADPTLGGDLAQQNSSQRKD